MIAVARGTQMAKSGKTGSAKTKRKTKLIRVYVEFAEAIEDISSLERVSVADSVERGLMETTMKRLRQLVSEKNEKLNK